MTEGKVHEAACIYQLACVDSFFTQCEKEADVCFESLYSLPVNTDDGGKEILLACFFNRALTTYQGICLLVKANHANEARVLARTLLEIVFRASAIILKDDVLEKYIIDDEKNISKALKRVEEAPDNPAFPRCEIEEFKEQWANADKLDGNPQSKEMTVQWYARQAGMEDVYNNVYRQLCQSSHISASELKRYFEVKENEIVGLVDKPDIEDSLHSCTLGARLLEVLVDKLSSVFPAIDAKEIIRSELCNLKSRGDRIKTCISK